MSAEKKKLTPQEESDIFFEGIGIALEKLSDEGRVVVKEQMQILIAKGFELAAADYQEARQKTQENYTA